MKGFSFTPDFEIELTWYQEQQMKSKRSKFYIVKDAPFDILLGSWRFAHEFKHPRSPALILASRRKGRSKLRAYFNYSQLYITDTCTGELEAEKISHEHQLQEGREEEACRQREANRQAEAKESESHRIRQHNNTSYPQGLQ